ncbi:shikimate kinase [Flavobacterium sp. Fl-77]|uniref:Shikimate kinase n=1 Tax=Flavobacterium flavipigmentatum TaxID=2893884 RepID=A0AAJ2SFK0_9FLAO|nr:MULTISPECIES: shikimate kinase [unclassified Flavobacterium]MDX6182536.1 shikimate kinase [Flavobacterium sp. Fl-33]MDX6185551.1 shikimate kinase [Flavobacterium sp. Fl-77]UFH38741.1 AAA family ATPase [Flavobacterium sp. F-70]
MKKIILLGYMGSGKSTIAQKLSKITNIPFLDLDICIEERAKKSINSIFEEHGEIYFRKLEHQIFLELLQSSEKSIIGLGGGTPCYAKNHELLKREDVISIYLKASIDTLYNRLVHNKSKRPLIASMNEDEMREFIAKHLFDRSFYYNQAQNKVSVDGKTADETVQDILALLA